MVSGEIRSYSRPSRRRAGLRSRPSHRTRTVTVHVVCPRENHTPNAKAVVSSAPRAALRRMRDTVLRNHRRCVRTALRYNDERTSVATVQPADRRSTTPFDTRPGIGYERCPMPDSCLGRVASVRSVSSNCEYRRAASRTSIAETSDADASPFGRPRSGRNRHIAGDRSSVSGRLSRRNRSLSRFPSGHAFVGPTVLSAVMDREARLWLRDRTGRGWCLPAPSNNSVDARRTVHWSLSPTAARRSVPSTRTGGSTERHRSSPPDRVRIPCKSGSRRLQTVKNVGVFKSFTVGLPVGVSYVNPIGSQRVSTRSDSVPTRQQTQSSVSVEYDRHRDEGRR